MIPIVLAALRENPAAGPGVRAAVRPDGRPGGFRHFGDFAACVRMASGGDANALGKLQILAAVGPGANEGAGTDGGFLVPPDFRDTIMRKVMGEESLLSRCDQITTASNNVVLPKDEVTPWGTSGIRVYWESEANQLTASKPAFDQITMRLNKLTALVRVSDELLDDSPALDGYLRSKTPEALTSVINLAIVQGNGVGKPLGIMLSPALVTVSAETSQPADTIHHRNIVKMFTRMHAPCRARSVWLIHPDAEAQLHLMSFRDGTSTPVPVYLPPGGLSASPYGTLLGRPVLPLQAMETVGDLGDIILADMTQYLVLLKTGGLRTDVSMHLYFDYGQQAYRFTLRMTGTPWWSSAITQRDGANTQSCFVTLASR